MTPIHPGIVVHQPGMAKDDRSQRRFLEQKCESSEWFPEVMRVMGPVVCVILGRV